MSRLRVMLKSPWYVKMQRLRDSFVLIKTLVYYRQFFGSVGMRTRIYKPTLIGNPQWIFIGDRTLIRQGARLEALRVHNRPTPQLIIGNNVNIEQNVHIVCHCKVQLHDNVSITANCAIVDTSHPLDAMTNKQKMGELIVDDRKEVIIGEGTFIGIGCVILPGVHIGTRCVIGANSVVTNDIPDYSIAAGAPARIIRSLLRAREQ